MNSIYCWHLITEDSPWARKRLFNDICEADGELIASAFQGRMQNPKIQDLDKLAGDDEYIFLGLTPYNKDVMIKPVAKKFYSELIGEYGFGFDAVELIKAGAILGKEDLLEDYRHEIRELFMSRGLGYYGLDNKNIILNLYQYDLIEEAEKILRACAAKKRLVGEEALEYLGELYDACIKHETSHLTWDDYEECEILVPERLSLKDFCIFTIEDGEIRVCNCGA